jgi:sulfur-carrier protein
MTMRVTLEFCGVLERLAGQATLELSSSAGATVAEVLATLVKLRPALAGTVERSACAVGDTLVRRTAEVPPGTRLVLLPPVAGG